ncbi:MAG: hypothetical protein JW850_16710 [Thermoflexales bacterium]|nr:hypothetical protein [Thermoflexales bacterium]
MTRQFHGVTSISLVGVATLIATVIVFRASWVLGVVYLLASGAAVFTILYAYCAKCPCQAHCAHVLPGKAAIRFGRNPGPYSRVEIGAMLAALVVILGFPQAWLWQYPLWFGVYWVLSLIAFVQIRIVVCRACANVYCPLRAAQ